MWPSTPHPRHSLAQQHTTGISNKIRGPPPTHTDPSTSNGHPNQSSVFGTPNLEPQTSPASSIITTKPQTKTQGGVALNVPTPLILEEIVNVLGQSPFGHLGARMSKR